MRHFRRHERGRREPGHGAPRRRARHGTARHGTARHGPTPRLGRGSGLPRAAAVAAAASSRCLPANGGCGPTARPSRSAARSRAGPRPPRPRFRPRFGFFPCETPSEGGDTRAWVKRNLQNPAQPWGSLETLWPPQPARSSPGGEGCWPLRDGEGRPRCARDTRGPPRQPACAVTVPAGDPGPAGPARAPRSPHPHPLPLEREGERPLFAHTCQGK